MSEKDTKTKNEGSDKLLRLDGKTYSLENPTDTAQKALNSLAFADRKIAELRGEMSLATTARTGFINIIKRELVEIPQTDEGDENSEKKH